ncbi:Os03g0655000 [Oryza sativa Japonica Group]|uniref:Os03g0655000 protein n=1 Tax=Oryza sativa subsp. japonica TaxID=39947 RepID=A0A0P0W1H3_ORYSJ|nr:hypothetical protein EE612_019358 [Oryza sativa]BAS85544.1 Os03g0655000 [Oryza sativa Japonica Group]
MPFLFLLTASLLAHMHRFLLHLLACTPDCLPAYSHLHLRLLASSAHLLACLLGHCRVELLRPTGDHHAPLPAVVHLASLPSPLFLLLASGLLACPPAHLTHRSFACLRTLPACGRLAHSHAGLVIHSGCKRCPSHLSFISSCKQKIGIVPSYESNMRVESS